MQLSTALQHFASDTKVHILLLLIVVDLVIGVVAAVKVGTFKLSWITNFLKDDVLFKVVPYFVLYFIALISGNTSVSVGGFDFNVLADGAYALAIAAMAGSLIGSLKDLGIVSVPSQIT